MERILLSRYVDILKEIVDIIHNDYSGYKDKRNWDNPTYFIGKIEKLEFQNQITSKIFVNTVNEYLMVFQDQHMSISIKSNGDIKN